MNFLPNDLKPFETKALFLYAHRHVKEILFSQGTYEVAVYEPADQETYWPFLQIDDEGNLDDSFCTCETSEEGNGCPHIAAAFLKIFAKTNVPMHIRFQNSFWKVLFEGIANELEYDPNLSSDPQDGFSLRSEDERFAISAKSSIAEKMLDEIFINRPEETQESSIKFSNLSRDEILLWKRGSPSKTLRFELSCWGDLAKELFIMQENGTPYSIDFSKDNTSLPTEVEITCNGLEIFIHKLSKKIWPKLVTTISTVKSSLQIFAAAPKELENVIYDPEKRQITLEIRALSSSMEKESHAAIIPLDKEWSYVPNKGFVSAKIDPLLDKSTIPSSEVGSFLLEYGERIYPYIKKHYQLDYETREIKYSLHIDKSDALHIAPYLFVENDLQMEDAALFGDFVFIPQRGFYRLTHPPIFESLHTEISREDLEDFIQANRGFLANISGFEVHIGGLESHLSYHFTQKKELVFSAKLDVPYLEEGMIDYDNYIYIKKSGFYPKREGKENGFRPGLKVPQKEIEDFITNHKDDLEQIREFFIPENPIEKIGLSVTLIKDDRIKVAPKAILKEAYSNKKVKFFGKILHIQDEGFYPISPADYFPPGYEEEKIIPTAEEIFFLREEVDRLKEKIIFLSRALVKPKKWILAVKSLQKRAKNHFIADLSYRTKSGEISVVDLWEAIDEKKFYLFSKGGLILLDDPRFNWIGKLKKTQINFTKRQIKISSLEWLKLMATEELSKPLAKTKQAEETRKLIGDLSSLESLSLLDTNLLKSTLRSYQERGLAWLWFLYCYGLSGLLCDEMGLGKTHQAMALISAIFSLEEKKDKKFIVVCPTSVIYHWQELLETFLPSIKVCFYHGLDRTLDDDYDLILTSYGILRHDVKKIPLKGYELAVFDEVQFAKNPHSKTHKTLSKIVSTMKLGLTGTPIENRIKELKALFDLVLPSYLPGEKVFKERFVVPIEKEHSQHAQEKLQQLIKPFILRRMKAEVLKELPEKIEEIAYCDLSPEQRTLYNRAINQSREEIFSEINEKKPSAYIHVFSLLMQLKQICDHPALILKDPQSYEEHQSGKWELFCDLLSEIRDSKQKVVIFTQYLDMIEIIETYLTSQKVGFATIKGSTKNRKEEIDRFKKDPKCEVFIGSLLAAGVGIDLSNASVVIHFDRWWNPAKENQATDRVHRIGQKRGVQVFKLVSKNTMEERIHQIIEEKSILLEEVVGSDLDQIKSLSPEELREILRELPMN